MRKLLAVLCLSIGLLTGCSSLKEKTGEYVVEAVTEKVTNNIDQLLDKRGLSLSQISNATDQNSDGQLDRTEVVNSVKETTRDYVLLETKKFLEETIAENQKAAITKTDLEATKLNFINWLLGLIVAYLGKQIVSAKRDGKRDERIAVLEKLLNRDIDGDGTIGAVTALAKNDSPSQSPAA